MHDPGSHPAHAWTAPDALRHLEVLREERALARLTGLLRDAGYAADLDDDIAQSTHAYVGLAVTELATLRAELDGPKLG